MIQFHRASITDIPLVHSLAKEIWPSVYAAILSPDQIEYMMDLFYAPSAIEEQIVRRNHQFLMATLEEKPIGYASFSQHEDDEQIFHLHKLYLHQNTRKRGLGKAFLQFIMKDISHQGGKELHLNVNRFNPALDFYKRLGFSIIRTEDIDIGGGYFMNDYVMGIPLK